MLNDTTGCEYEVPLSDQRTGEDEQEISFKTRAWLTVAILSSELLIAFNIAMVRDIKGLHILSVLVVPPQRQ